MEEKFFSIKYRTGNNLEELSADLQDLLKETRKFSQNSYSPYSDFKVSACLILDTGETVRGANVENASYPVSICAERTLLSHTVCNYPNSKIKVLAIYVDRDLEQPVPPCGMCRQTILEIEERQELPIEIILFNKKNDFIILDCARDLLPLSFDWKFL